LKGMEGENLKSKPAIEAEGCSKFQKLAASSGGKQTTVVCSAKKLIRQEEKAGRTVAPLSPFERETMGNKTDPKSLAEGKESSTREVGTLKSLIKQEGN